MLGIPEGVIYALVFGAVLLLQFLLKRLAPRPQSPSLPTQPPDQELQAQEQTAGQAQAERAAREGRIARSQAAAAALAQAGQRPHRYSRSALLGTPRATQNAMVNATILGPCRALSPHDTGQADQQPRSASGRTAPPLKQ